MSPLDRSFAARLRVTRFACALALAALSFNALSADLPNRALTPGAVDPAVTPENVDLTVCARVRPTWAKAHRPPVALTNRLKREQIRLYGYSDKDPRHCEEDHLVPISLGGLSYSASEHAMISGRDAANLWPQPRTTITEWGAEKKDERHEIGLREAQAAFTTNWIKAYQEYASVRTRHKLRARFED